MPCPVKPGDGGEPSPEKAARRAEKPLTRVKTQACVESRVEGPADSDDEMLGDKIDKDECRHFDGAFIADKNWTRVELNEDKAQELVDKEVAEI